MNLRNGKEMETLLKKIQNIRRQFPVQCNPNLLACAIQDHLETTEGRELMTGMLPPENDYEALKERLLRQSMLFLGFSVESHYGRDVFYSKHAA